MSYIENTKKVKHNLTPEQVEFLQKPAQEIEEEMFDYTGRPIVEDYEFIVSCFKKAVEVETINPEQNINCFDAYKYFRSSVCSFNESEVKKDYNLMVTVFKYSSELFIKSMKNSRNN